MEVEVVGQWEYQLGLSRSHTLGFPIGIFLRTFHRLPLRIALREL
jgi:hypothetical protein